ncbi:hypothetical protein ACNFJN_04480 [Xenorhabdus budapestensis]|uniref:Phage protein n=1 Tax=Xenorhabdus budapestensis TaxID=290110 RepID=A0ABX7VM27_XENBU|nr:hypothetical protein [Xenorhabdus budapestensis]QTL40565.1 hypothetical protein HGO23_04020 [Xenorhabdus budapestensis]
MYSSISYSFVESKERVNKGRTYITYTDMGDMTIDIPFKEYASRTDIDVSDMFAYARVHCDEERIAEEMVKAGFSYREIMAIAQYMHREAA